ncbi:MBL fold metallo-hydrolase [Neolewinella persica]|uniref:MBL fold metallo-hydrolase n=1 Tax=Neolewinella persica TaxID=70998 RepID=UPI0003658CDE|nr:MBL fold metallo-hydrolase [Neolewinella persica]
MKPHWLVGLAALPIAYLGRKLRNDPQFGASAGAMKYVKEQGSVAWKMGAFRNLDKTRLQEDIGSLFGDLVGYIQAKHTQPETLLPVALNDTALQLDPSKDFMTWYGHSALRLESGGKTILLDPMLGEWVAPVPFLGHRFPYQDYNPLADFGTIDLIVYSHDHYDHLDFDTLMAIKDRTKAFLCPLGLGAHLVSWGIPQDKITEVDWWQSVELAGCRFTATPARHFSGRSPSTRNKSLWTGFVIETNLNKLYFGGDSGYGRHFKEIHRKLGGGYDLTMLDSGQYHDRWKNVHMQPEEALQAHAELDGKNLLPIHWGAFSLSNHAWFDPAERITKADAAGCVVSPMVGQRFEIGNTTDCQEHWWVEPSPSKG